ncbi:MAG: CocE/NonD family hydrolase [Candidatus Latescibacteria bacterium]|nr:CocE/NonD family hydrolase [bacterium]MBD3423930.1 CocE/NonD family hydrolase [Candidatus Latescibacterota bacterium]
MSIRFYSAVAAVAIVIFTAVSAGAFEEEAVFFLYKNESKIGTIDYNYTSEGEYNRVFTLSMMGQEAVYRMEVTPGEGGEWAGAVFYNPNDTVEVARSDSSAVFEANGKEYSVSFEPGSILYDNYGPVFETLMLKQYDMQKGGEQIFPRFLIPQKMVDVSVEYTGRRIAAAGEEKMEFLLFDMELVGIELKIWADSQMRIYMMDVPVQYAAYVRRGYQNLLRARKTSQDVSQPVYEIEKRTTMVPMRDGVELATDMYFPGTDTLKFPAILIRTPYKKETNQLDGEYWARRGYAVAVQDCRGRFSSKGDWEPFVHEADDGYDTVEWLASREWSNGKVGMIGASYVGWVQLWAASARPPHLTTIIPQVAPPDPFFNIPYEYGAFFILGSFWWAEVLETEATGDLTGSALSKIGERKYEKILKSLPVIDLDTKVLGSENTYWRKWIRNNVNNDYWEKCNFMEKLKKVDIPVFFQSGWFDGDAIGTKLNYLAMKEGGNSNLKMIMGPWGHTNQSSTRLGSIKLGKEAGLDLQVRFHKWFDYWLKGMENDIMEEPEVMLYDLFSNRWQTGDSYPLPHTEFAEFYLESDRGANTSNGDGRLTLSATDGGSDYDEYEYDPGDPTPSPVYYFKSEEETEKEEKEGIDLEKLRKAKEEYHNSVTAKRDDILVYVTGPLDSAVTIAGPVSAEIYASTTARDTDWFVTLSREDSEGRIMQLCKGVIRARFRESTHKPELLEPEQVYKYDIDMWHTGITFKEGERIRVEVSSALFPLFSRNLNTGGHNEMETEFVTARQRLYHSTRYPSHVILPVIEKAE